MDAYLSKPLAERDLLSENFRVRILGPETDVIAKAH